MENRSSTTATRRHRLRTAVLALASGALAACTPSVASGAVASVRGTWVSTTSYTSTTSAVYSNATTTSTFKTLRDIGLNTVYMDIWRDGNTYYNSPTLQSVTGRLRDTKTRDLLAETIIQAHRNQMALIGWFQYGLMARSGAPSGASDEVATYMKNRGWLLERNTTTPAVPVYTDNNVSTYTWMNPLVPEVRAFVKNLVLDAVRNYNMDGIQFDDHLAWPKEMGWDATTKATYLSETGRALPTNIDDANFKAWRSTKVTSFAQELITAIREVKPGIIISLSPSVYPTSYNSYCVDWPAMASAGMFDEIVPQVYRSTASDFDRDWDGLGALTNGGQLQYMNTRRGDLVAGIAINTSGTQPWSVVGPQVAQVDATPGVAGESFWFSSGVVTLASSLTAYYNVAANGHAERPDLPLSQLPIPVVGTAAGSNNWTFNLTFTGYFDLLALDSTGSAGWNVRQTGLLLVPGTYTFNVASASKVELLGYYRASLIPEPAGLVWLAAMVPVLGRRGRRS